MAKILPIQRQLRGIAWALLLFGAANSLVGVFIPLIVLQNGGSLQLIASFYLVYALIKLVCNYPMVRFTQRYGAHFSLAVGFIFGAVQLLGIFAYARHQSLIALFIGSLGLALCNAAIWNAQHIHISRVMDTATKSSSLASMQILSQVLGVIMPIIGAIIGTYLNQGWLIGLAVALVLVAIIPLRSVGKLDKETPSNETFAYNLKGAPKRDLVANFCFNVETSVGFMLWPIYLAYVLHSYSTIGAVTAISALVTILFVWLAGHRGDKGQDRKVLLQGVTTVSIIDVIRIFATTTFWITVVSAAYKSSLAYLQNAWTSTYYHHAKQKGIHYIISMEIACDIAYVTLWAILLIASNLGGSKLLFNSAFIIAAIAAWGILLIKPQKAA